MKQNTASYLGLLLLLPAAALLVSAGCEKPTSPPASKPALKSETPAAPVAVNPSATPVAVSPPALNSAFVGKEVCKECHAKEFDAHKGSFHSVTAQLVSSLGKIALPHGPLPGTKIRLTPSGDSFRIAIEGSDMGAERMQYALGSGKTGVTFVSVIKSENGPLSLFNESRPDTLFEMRSSYFPRWKTWYVTPGQKRLEPDDLGLDHPTESSRLCMSCHTTTLPAASILPEKRFLGVGCEACHGPGSAHIVAVRKGDLKNLGMERLGQYGAGKLNILCGRCHRTEKDVMARTPQLAQETQRFQTAGLMMSRCFKESNDTLSCLTCHDPHKNASLDMKRYEKTCLNCHSDRTAGTGKTAKAGVGKPCPVNPRDGCIPCHMPARKILPQAARSPVAADHFIHIPPKGSPPAPYRPL